MVFSGGDLPQPTHVLNLVKRDLETGQMARDMTLFRDDDGKAYHIYSSEENSTLHIALLDEDYTSHTGQYIRVFADRFMEAPAMFKRDGKYYLIMSGCTGWAPNPARSAVSDSIFGEWEELGNPCIGEGAETTFVSQSTFVLQVAGTDKYIYMGDRWRPENPIDGSYVWLPINFTGKGFTIEWKDRWSLDDFNE
jgi:beta-xylosidase